MMEQVPFCSPLACGSQAAFVLLFSLALHRDKATGLSLQAAPALLPPGLQVKAQFPRLPEKEDVAGSSSPSVHLLVHP